jgi:hypothetical protein
MAEQSLVPRLDITIAPGGEKVIDLEEEALREELTRRTSTLRKFAPKASKAELQEKLLAVRAEEVALQLPSGTKISALRVVDLKSELSLRGLSEAGLKPVLALRLLAARLDEVYQQPDVPVPTVDDTTTTTTEEEAHPAGAEEEGNAKDVVVEKTTEGPPAVTHSAGKTAAAAASPIAKSPSTKRKKRAKSSSPPPSGGGGGGKRDTLGPWIRRVCLVPRGRLEVPPAPVLEPMNTTFVERFGPGGEAHEEEVVGDVQGEMASSNEDEEEKEGGAAASPFSVQASGAAHATTTTTTTTPAETHLVRLFNLPYERSEGQILADGILFSGGVADNHQVSK